MLQKTRHNANGPLPIILHLPREILISYTHF